MLECVFSSKIFHYSFHHFVLCLLFFLGYFFTQDVFVIGAHIVSIQKKLTHFNLCKEFFWGTLVYCFKSKTTTAIWELGLYFKLIFFLRLDFSLIFTSKSVSLFHQLFVTFGSEGVTSAKKFPAKSAHNWKKYLLSVGLAWRFRIWDQILLFTYLTLKISGSKGKVFLKIPNSSFKTAVVCSAQFYSPKFWWVWEY
jgi:hypothetical protein